MGYLLTVFALNFNFLSAQLKDYLQIKKAKSGQELNIFWRHSEINTITCLMFKNKEAHKRNIGNN